MAPLAVPKPIPYANGNGQTPYTSSTDSSGSASAAKFPHTRAQLAAIARQYKPADTYDGNIEVEEANRVPSSLVTKVVSFLVDEKEDELKAALKEAFPEMNDVSIEQSVLDLMHKHRDDVAGVPFLFLTPTRRPISRPSSRASTHSSRLLPTRPDTPTSAPSSPLAHSLSFRRPHTPITSPLASAAQASGYMSAKSDYSPSSSPILMHAHISSQFTASLPASPLSSPRLLNAKASEFRPIPRPLSAASSNPGSLLRADTPSPDLWAHNSPRATSNLAIAAPLLPEHSFSRSNTPSSNLRSSTQPEEEEDDDPFDGLANNLASTFHSITISDFDTHWSPPDVFDSMENKNNGQPTYPGIYGYGHPDSMGQPGAHQSADMLEGDDTSILTDGMTPLDVLSSVFGSTLAPSELEEALNANGYDFERAMAWLIDRQLPQQAHGPPNRPVIHNKFIQVGRDSAVRGRGFGPGHMAGPGRGAPRYVNGRPVPNGNRVCRYFVAGECLRADCRFSHDLERALCRFWLRGTCAKNESCEFLHHIPKDVDINAVNAVLSRANVPPGTGPLANFHQVQNNPGAQPNLEEFPVLGYEGNGNNRGRKHQYNDPGRTRFAAAVKKPAPNVPQDQQQQGNRPGGDLSHPAIVAPRPSPRIKLRAPALLPTLPTGEALNNLYMTYRSRALQLGAARNACLSRAADAWRRGDGAAAKRFSREGHELNAKMSAEMADAASKLVRERARVAEQAVRSRDASWSDDPGDRAARGKVCGGGLGVCLGIASRVVGEGLNSEERTEAMLDLHGLHSNEATEVLEKFLLALEREHFYGLAYAIVGEEKHTGTQDAARGASRLRLATGVREWLHRWGYPWNERDGIICIDPLTHASE
ncbi:hypothetical protein CC1G_05686 [Coprinopsis cinerea okayama7|uniref:Uncharacterized protein n=1 Tax=Coprinopsis cinerea (strain Okayama-7 / 130 / ATCC MYA-4618 / FGSC 9003) TaxID=240176 RepID=A8N9V9_COPC7|nr:hypothetical protein CC1G_05686 [Coprinopsis cinerea okayama7\|eukprot:XP_001831615.1 hypothetical protein CC1G_05686 [Coprinopsis cinerea okayama7\